MKFNLVILLSAALMSTSAYSQTGAGAGGASAGGTGAGATVNGGVTGTGQGTGAAGGVSTSTSTSAGGNTSAGGGSTTTSTTTSGGVRVNQQPAPGGPGFATKPGVPPPEGFPPGRPLTAQQQQQVPSTQPGVNPPPGATNITQNPSSNQIPADTNAQTLNANQSTTNQAGFAGDQTTAGTANPNLTPTSQPGATNRVMSTNAPGLLNPNPLMRDQAISVSDGRLLSQIRAAVFGRTQGGAPLGGSTVHFILKDGSVRLVGTVASDQERQRIENLVQQVPGVVRVYDALEVSNQPTVPQPTRVPAQTGQQ